MRWDENESIYLTLVGLLPKGSLKQHELAKTTLASREAKTQIKHG